MASTLKTAFITGITGQDGSYLAELLLEKGYKVHGTVRRSSMTERPRLDHIPADSPLRNRLVLHYADLSDMTTLRRLINSIKPDEFYHLAGQSHVGLSFEIPESTCDFTAMGTLRLLEILRDCCPKTKFLNIGSSEIFGLPTICPQTAETPKSPSSPYGAAKAFSVDMTRIYRDSFDMFAASAICYNHESPRRGLSFVTRKIARGAAEIKFGLRDTIALGNLDTKRDWGYAPEYVDAMWRMLQLETPRDIVLATGRLMSLRQLLEAAFNHVGLDWQEHVTIDQRFMRLSDPTSLVGDPSAAKTHLNWEATVFGAALAEVIVDFEVQAIAKTGKLKGLDK